ncbi:LCP family protein [Actinomadura rubrisoli]|uniref:LytR family transcriptional regulator n=1 Tax=Actinomadura rubrisoli TaxID=2530368 RepID=A0A4R5C5L4_9ACTN|nr:LCP family protein [Actinomadura rubrisoli]TDD93786.1 LytR family transcriptional regulator [Actinomadura rubrisoli]
MVDEAAGRAWAAGPTGSTARRGRRESGPPEPAGLPGLAAALLIAAVSPVLPGVAHLRAGRVRLGQALLAAQALLVAAASLAAGRGRAAFLDLSVRPGRLLLLMAASVAVAALWALLIVHSYAVLAPGRLSPLWRLAGGTTVSVLCLLVIVPPLTVAHYGYLQRDMISSVFPDAPRASVAREPGTAAPARDGIPPASGARAGTPRLDVLLIGADAGARRPGIRTDGMTLASIDTRTGDTLLLGLPRDLRHVPVWSGSGPVPYPPGRPLDEVYAHGLAHPGVLAGGGRVRDPGAELLKRTAGHILGRPVPYYAMVDMRSLRLIVEAVGGLRICVDEAVPVPGRQAPAGVLRPGCRRLSGREALGFGRPPAGGSGHDRMARQKCLLWALARQAGPVTMLRGFQRLTRILKDSVTTDLPRSLLPALVALAGRAGDAEVTGLRFDPPAFAAERPDYGAIRRTAARAVREAGPGSHRAAGVHILGKSCT